MRTLLLLRGSPGCGKSTWIALHGLQSYVLSADDIRMMCSGPVLNIDGKYEINQNNDKFVWSTLFRLLEQRMQNGEFTVIDATNSKTSEMNRYKDLCATYRYRIYCVDFTELPIEEAKRRNRERPELKRVPDEVIDKMYSRFATQKIPAGITVIKPDELDRIWMNKIDLSEYKKIHVIGDVHGCNTALRAYLGEIKDDEFYILTGDYVDRGIENADVVSFLISVRDHRNVLMLEGNHERWLWIWANGGVCESKEFELQTKTQLENAKIDKKEVRMLYRRFAQCAWFDYNGKEFLVTHGGLSRIPENITLVATRQMIHGVGSYADGDKVDESFMKHTAGNCYQIHGHRNVRQSPVQVNDRCFNLEGKVEFGGNLRCVDITPEGIVPCEIPNPVFRQTEAEAVIRVINSDSGGVGDAILAMRNNKYIDEKRFGNISSFNFTRQAFYDRVWNDQTVKARGLYINIPEERIVARSYDKFFAINERSDTKLEMLQHKLAFPVTAYVKENGFLGIVSYNDEDDSLFVTTKSNPEGACAVLLDNMLHRKLSGETLDAIKAYSKEHNVSFVFECVDQAHDPHIIEYPESGVYLLDIIYNELEYRKVDFNELCDFADKHGIPHKERAYVIESWSEFYDWYYNVLGEDYKYNGRDIEGFVLEDANGYMLKLKLTYYNFWKFMRGIAHEVIRKGYIDPKRTSALTAPIANAFYGWMKELVARSEDREAIPSDILTLRRMFLESEAGEDFRV